MSNSRITNPSGALDTQIAVAREELLAARQAAAEFSRLGPEAVSPKTKGAREAVSRRIVEAHEAVKTLEAEQARRGI
jgi:hypothetical protein